MRMEKNRQKKTKKTVEARNKKNSIGKHNVLRRASFTLRGVSASKVLRKKKNTIQRRHDKLFTGLKLEKCKKGKQCKNTFAGWLAGWLDGDG